MTLMLGAEVISSTPALKGAVTETKEALGAPCAPGGAPWQLS